MATIDNLSLNITAQATDATKKIRGLSEALNSLKSSAGVNSAVKNLTNLKEAITSLNRVRFNEDKIKTISSGIRSIRNSISGISMSDINKVQKLSAALSMLGSAPTSAFKSISKSSKDAISKKIGEEPKESEKVKKPSREEIAEAKEEAKKLKDEIKKAEKAAEEFDKRAESVAASLRKVASTPFKLLAKSFSAMGSAFKRLTEPFRNFIRSLGRIALYRVLRSVIKAITSGVKEGIENLARFSKLMNEMDTHKANRVMSLYASNFLYLKNTIATAVIPILKALEPVVDMVINRIVDLTNVIAQLFSAITGSTTYTRAKYYFIDYADSLDKASGSAKKLNKQLAQFDELNNLTTSSGSGSGSDLDYLKMFEDPVPIADWIQELKKHIQNGDWKIIGQEIANKIEEGLGSINWEKAFRKSFNAGKNLAYFLNGLIDPDEFREVGKTIAGAIMMGINFALGFSDNFNWDNLGLSIAEGINGFFQNFDGVRAAEAISSIAHGLDEALTRAAKSIKWGEVFKDLFGFFSHLVIDNMDLVVKYFLISQGAKLAWGFASGVLESLTKEIGAKITAELMAKLGIKITSLSVTEIGSQLGVKFATGVSAKLAQKVGEQATAELATQGVTAELGTVNVGVGAGTKVLGASTVGGYIAGAIIAAVVGYMAGNWLEEKISELTGNDLWLYNLPKPGIDNPNDKKISNPTYTRPLTSKEYLDEQAKKKGNLGDVGNGAYSNLKLYRTFTNTPRSISQQIYDTKAASAFSKLNNATITTTKNASTASAAFNDLGKEVSRTSSSAFGDLSKSSSSAFNKVTISGKSTSASVTNGLNLIKSNGDKTFSYSVWNNYGKNISDSLGASIDDVKNRWEALQKSMGSSVSVSSGGATSYVPSSTATLPTVTNYNAPGVKPNPTWHNLPTKPSGMPTSAWESYLANWKKQNPQNYYAKGGFPSMGSMFIAGEAGAELVGNINGRTGVANTDQIEDAIYQASYDAMSKALSENNMSVIVEGDTDGMFRAFQRKANDFYTRTGRHAI